MRIVNNKKLFLTFFHIILLCLFCLLASADDTISTFEAIPRWRVETMQQSTGWLSLWKDGRSAAHAKEYKKAVQKYLQLLKVKKNLNVARWELAQLYMRMQMWDEAIRIIEILIEAAPAHQGYKTAMADIMWRNDSYDRSVTLFKDIYRDNPDDQFSLARIIEGLIKLGQRQDALPLLGKLKSTTNVSFEIKRFLANVAFEKGKFQQALPYLLELIEKDGTDTDLIQLTALTYDYLDEESEAIIYWQKIILLLPDNIAARQRLATFYEGRGDLSRTLKHLKAILKKNPDSYAVMKRCGDLLFAKGDRANALNYYLRYLQKFSSDQNVLRSIIKIYADSGDRDNTFAFLEKYFVVRNPSDPAELHLEATLYDATGRFKEAIEIYKQLLELSPDNTQFLAALVNDLLAIGENDRALSMWKKLGEIAQDRLAVYEPMARLLEHLGRDDELIEVLKIIHSLDRDNTDVILKLANLYYSADQKEMALNYYELIPVALQTEDIITKKGAIWEYMGLLEVALQIYEELLALSPELKEIRLRSLVIAGKLGLMQRAEHHWDNYSSYHGENDEFLLIKADILRQNGFFVSAEKEIRKLVSANKNSVASSEQNSIDSQHKRFLLFLKLAEIYQDWGKYEAAEQMLRVVLADYPMERELILIRMSHLALQTNNLPDAQAWISALHDDLESVKIHRTTVMKWQYMLLEAELLMRHDEVDEAEKICRAVYKKSSFEEQLPSTGSQSTDSQSSRIASGILLAKILIKDERVEQAAEVVQELLEQIGNDQRLLVLNEQIVFKLFPTNRDYSLQTLIHSINEQGYVPLYTLLNIAGQYREAHDWQALMVCSQLVLKKAPLSLRAALYIAESQMMLENHQLALQEYKTLLEAYPANTLLLEKVIQLEYENGNLAEALHLCNQLLSKDPLRYDIIRIKARIFWALGQSTESLDIFNDILDGKVEETLKQKLEAIDFIPGLAPVKSFWNTVTFSPSKAPPLIDVVMSSEFATNPGEQFLSITHLVAPYYEQYRWHLIFKEERDARLSMRAGEYHKALKELTALNNKSLDDPTLFFDIAYVYSRLARLDDENRIHEYLIEYNPDFPGLDKAITRNVMQARPYLGVRFFMQENDGWNNYKALREQSIQTFFNYTPKNSTHVKVEAFIKKYQSTVNDLHADSTGIIGSYSLRFKDAWKIGLSGGVERLDDEQGNTAVWSGELSGDIYENLWGKISYERNLVADTVASLTRNIIQQKTTIVLSTDIIPRFDFGGKYGFIDYSDENHMYHYELGAVYTLFYEPTLLELSFRYNVQDSDRTLGSGPVLADGFSITDHPYWSPSYYWLNNFSLYFKYQLSDDSLDRDVGRYYTVKYSLGYDSRGYDLQALEGSFFIELNKKIIVKTSADIQTLKSFQSKKIQLTVTARW